MRILLGSIHQLEALADLPKIRHLALWRILKLAGVEFISRMEALEGLSLESLSGVEAFPATKRLGKLRVVKLAGMNKLRDFSSLERAPALEEFVFQKVDRQRPEDFIPVLRNAHLKRAGLGFHKKDDVRTMTALLAEHQIDGEVFMYPQVRGSFPWFT